MIKRTYKNNKNGSSRSRVVTLRWNRFTFFFIIMKCIKANIVKTLHILCTNVYAYHIFYSTFLLHPFVPTKRAHCNFLNKLFFLFSFLSVSPDANHILTISVINNSPYEYSLLVAHLEQSGMI